MRLLLINYEYPPVGGGAANATWEMARALIDLGHVPVVLTARFHSRKTDEANPNIKVIQVPAIRRRVDRSNIFEMTCFVFSAGWRIRQIIFEERIEGMIAFFSIPCGPIAWWGAKKYRIPYIVSLRGGDVPGNEPGIALLHSLLQRVRRTVFRNAAAIIANSSGLKEASEKADPFPVILVPNGVDPVKWSPAEARPVKSKKLKLLFVGRLQTQKNLTWLLSHLARWHKSNTDVAWSLDIVGDGPLRHSLEQMAATLGIAEAISWHGWVEQKRLLDFYRSADVFVSAAQYEGMPNAVLEAQSCGLPAVLSAVAGHVDLIKNNHNGRLFSLNSADEFEVIMRNLAASPELLESWRTNCRVHVKEFHSWLAVARDYLTHLAG